MDVFRGWLQLQIFASHAYGSWIGGWLIHGAWGLSDSSEQFLFLSGFTLGSVFARKAARQSWWAATTDMLGRTWRLYRTHLTVVIFFFFMVALAGLSRDLPMEAQRLGWGFLANEPLLAVPALLSMLYQPAFMGILPIFVWCMLALPAFAWAEARWGNAALLGSFFLYAASWVLDVWPPSLGPETGIGFNPFAWQFLFLAGAWLGRRALLLGQALPPLRWLTVLSVLIVLAGFYLRLSWYDFGLVPALFTEDTLIVGKEGLAFPRLIHALALAWLVSVAVPRDADWMHLLVARWLTAIGRHSLQVFCLGLFLSWGCTAAFRLWPGRWWLDPLLMVLGSLLLVAFARGLDHRRMVQRRVVPA